MTCSLQKTETTVMKTFKTRETMTKQITNRRLAIYMMPEGAERSGHNDQQESMWVEEGPQCSTVKPVEWGNDGGGRLPVSLTGKLW